MDSPAPITLRLVLLQGEQVIDWHDLGTIEPVVLRDDPQARAHFWAAAAQALRDFAEIIGQRTADPVPN